MALPKINITLDQGALGQTNQTKDGVVGMLLKGVAVSGTLDVNTSYLITSLLDAIDLGITLGGSNDYAYQQIKSFYDVAGNGAEVHLMVTDQDLPSGLDKVNNYAKKLLSDAKGAIRILIAGQASTGSETIIGGLDADAHSAVAKAQALAVEFANNYRPLRVVIGGNAYTGNVADLTDYSTSSHNRVAMFIGAEDNSKTAAIGKVAGRLAASPVQRKLSRVLDGAIAEMDEGFLTDGNPMEEAETDWDLLDDKCYSFFRNHTGRAGVFFSSDPTLTMGSDDYNSIARGRVIDKAHLIGYDVLLNHISDEVEVDAKGHISPALIKAWEGEIENAINSQMRVLGNRPEISAVFADIDPLQNVLSSSTLNVTLRIQPVGYADFINVTLGYALTVTS